MNLREYLLHNKDKRFIIFNDYIRNPDRNTEIYFDSKKDNVGYIYHRMSHIVVEKYYNEALKADILRLKRY